MFERLGTARRNVVRGGLVILVGLLLLVAGGLGAEGLTEDQEALLKEVMPNADTFSDREGQPPVIRGYRTDLAIGEMELVGYVFLTSDVPPEEAAYSGRIEVLVGMDLEGTLTGVRVLRYEEAISRILGDFLRREGFQEQFAGKHISDPFQVGRDVDGVSRATISVAAMARGVRNAARRVADAYLRVPEPVVSEDRAAGTGANILEQLERLSWPDMAATGLVTRITVSRDNLVQLDLSFAYIGAEALGEQLLGPAAYADVQTESGARAEEHHLMLVGVEGTYLYLFDPARLAVRQRTETFPISRGNFIYLDEPEEGKIAGQVAFVGVMLIDGAVDMAQPFTILYDLRPGTDEFSNEYHLPPDVLAPAQEYQAPGSASADEAAPELPVPAGDSSRPAAIDNAGSGSAAPHEDTPDSTPPDDPAPQSPVSSAQAPELGPADETAAESRVVDGSAAGPTAAETAPGPVFAVVEEESVLDRLVTGIRWTRVVALLSLFGLAAYAFVRKSSRARWLVLAYTLVYLGFVDGGFLSVSHITSGLKVGPSVYVSDLPLLLVVGVTAATTLLWGRVFCGFLCPFGALQDFLQRVVPRRFQRRMPQAIHDRALYIKYGLLALILGLAIVQGGISIFEYLEPFGTLFFISPSILLWIILIGVLMASLVVPRFYCRYVCPLGAALGLASFLSVFRIKRVDQCSFCVVCEQRCPVGAIRGASIDFKECVRCDICEGKLLSHAGACRHTIDEVRARLKSKSLKPVPQ